MRVLIDITHPADVHFFKNLVWVLRKNGHETLITARDKDVSLALLEELGLDHHCLSKEPSGLIGKAFELVSRNLRLLAIARGFRPDVMVARIGISIGPVGALLGTPRVVYEDTEHARLQLALSTPFATYICTGTGYLKSWGSRQVTYRGVPMLAYLDPRYFEPTVGPLREAGIDLDVPTILVRTVSWQAVHDRRSNRSSGEQLLSIIARLEPYGRVFVSAEGPISRDLEKYRVPVDSRYMLDLMAFCKLYVGEGGSMAAEAAILGTPAVYCNPLRCGYLLALESRYGLVHNADTWANGLKICEDLLGEPDLDQRWAENRQRLLDDSEDVVEFMVGMCERAVHEQ